ncbi:MAG: hypothetical protein FMNOHCHN_03772 [Ignavibacteriaceae bacterium]|nr:hypothetical protein [Ignavibacteriaceae bacterium]
MRLNDKIDQNFTKCEQEVLDLVVQGLSNVQIAKKLEKTKAAVQFHLTNIYKKTKAENRIELVNFVNQLNNPAKWCFKLDLKLSDQECVQLYESLRTDSLLPSVKLDCTVDLIKEGRYGMPFKNLLVVSGKFDNAEKVRAELNKIKILTRLTDNDIKDKELTFSNLLTRTLIQEAMCLKL